MDDDRIVLNEATYESMVDARIMRRLTIDPRYNNAADAYEQRLAEEAVEQEVITDFDQRYRVI